MKNLYCLVLSVGLFLVFTAAGGQSLDNSFGTGGKWSDNTTSNPYDNFTIDASGRIICTSFSGDTLFVRRLSANGANDNSFGNGGLAIHTSSSFYGLGSVATVGNNIYVGGSGINGGALLADGLILALNENGTINTGYGTQGMCFIDYSTTESEFVTIKARPDGKILAQITAQSNPSCCNAVKCINASGSVESGFNGGLGVWEALIAGTILRIESDNSFYYGGYSSSGFELQYGKRDSAGNEIFAAGVPNSNLISSYYPSCATQTDGKLITAQKAGGGAVLFALARYKATGRIDSAFGTNGITPIDLPSGMSIYEVRDIEQLQNGKIVILTEVSVLNSTRICLFQFHGNGSPDVSFGSGGYYVLPTTNSFNAGYSVMEQTPGKLLINAVYYATPNDRAYLVRLTEQTNGIAENTFDISIYPIPANELLTVKTDEAIKELSLYDMQGRLIKTFSAGISTFNVSALRPGIYYIEAETLTGRGRTRFIKH